MISIIGILIVLFFLVGFATVIGLMGWAIVKGRVGAAVLIAGMAFICLLFGGVVVAMFATYSQRRVASHAEMYNTYPIESAQFIDSVPTPESFTTSIRPTWMIAATPLLFIVVGVVALLVLVAKRGLAHGAAAGHGRIWPAFLVLPVLALIALGGIRFQSIPNSQFTVNTPAKPVPPVPPVPPTIRQMTVSPHGVVQLQRDQQLHQQKVLAENLKALNIQLQQQIEGMDIHQLMDSFDAPRIVLRAPVAPPTDPGMLLVLSVPQIVATATSPSKTVAVAKVVATAIAKSAEEVSEAEASLEQKEAAETIEASAIEEAAESKPPLAESPSAPEPPKPPKKPEKPKSIARITRGGGASGGKKASATAQVKPPQVAVTGKEDANSFFSPATPEKRPAWVDAQPKRSGNVHRELITT
jgi:hypothetical protein